jgi:rSAM/selenodomain-associated transferase 2
MDLSVIVPTLNEQDTVIKLLNDLQAQQGIALEIIIVDGGSHDNTADHCHRIAARAQLPVSVLSSDAGRAVQMNHGAAAATASELLFLHADTRLHDPNLLKAGLDCLRQQRARLGSNRIAGHFGLRFERSNEAYPLAYYFYESKTKINRADTINGDQGFMLAKPFFQALGGFDTSLPYMEDARLARNIFAQGKWISLPGYVWSSARRFEVEGLKERQILNSFLCNFDHMGLKQFFDQAKAVYRTQSHTGRLRLKPFLLLIHRMSLKLGFKRWAKMWYDTGAYVAANAWQLAFLLDCAQHFKHRLQLECPPGEGETPRLRYYDKRFKPAVESPPGRLLAALFTFMWFYALLIKSLLRP